MGKVGMTPTPAKMRQEAAQGVFASLLNPKKQRQSARRRCKRRQADRRLARQMFRESVARLTANLMRARSANRNERRYRAAHSAAQKRKGRLTSNER